MESFQATAPFLRTINQLQRYIRGFYVATLYVTDTTIEFFNAQGDRVEVNFAPDLANGSSEGSQVPLFHEDLQRIGYLAIELEKVEGEDWGSRWITFIMLLQHYYLLGERLAMYNWNAYAKQEMMNRFTANKFKGAWRITCRVFSLYQTRGVHNLLISHHLSANTLLVMTKEGFTSLFEEARRSHEEEIEFLIINNYS
ncbi:263_t:CDS:2 [Gigaspora rosea]|nr:263_t:CDS:2 [Gigaspora rosea]